MAGVSNNVVIDRDNNLLTLELGYSIPPYTPEEGGSFGDTTWQYRVVDVGQEPDVDLGTQSGFAGESETVMVNFGLSELGLRHFALSFSAMNNYTTESVSGDWHILINANEPAAQTFAGTPGEDIMIGGAGADFIRGLDSHDYIDGGPGDDILNGDAGSDELFGRAGADILIGG